MTTLAKELDAEFSAVDTEIGTLEAALRSAREPALHETIDRAIGLIKRLLRAYLVDCGKPYPVSEDVLEIYKGFVKGDPSLNAVRDNVRELVYYRNCVQMKREDALPAKPVVMAVRTARHVYLYLRTRCITEHRISENQD